MTTITVRLTARQARLLGDLHRTLQHSQPTEPARDAWTFADTVGRAIENTHRFLRASDFAEDPTPPSEANS